jgi:redox-sensitive bicupin YhaK (pirin superfamily)
MEIIHRDDLHRGGFAGLRETRMVMDRRVWGLHKEKDAWNGIGNFVYLADAKFLPKGETHMHNHHEIDVISVMVEGRIAHEGSLEHGQEMHAGHVQVQRAGGEGFSHNEVNPDDKENRMIQLWVTPERAGEPAGYKLYEPKEGELLRIYGGSTDQEETMDGQTLIDVGELTVGQNISVDGPFMAYVTRGSGSIGDIVVQDGNMIRGEDLSYTAAEATQIIVIHLEASRTIS